MAQFLREIITFPYTPKLKINQIYTALNFRSKITVMTDNKEIAEKAIDKFIFKDSAVNYNMNSKFNIEACLPKLEKENLVKSGVDREIA